MPSDVSLCRLLPRFRASLGNISIYPVKRNAITRSACKKKKKKKTKILLLPAHWSGALRRLLFTLSPLQTGGFGLNPRAGESVATPQTHSHLCPRSHPAGPSSSTLLLRLTVHAWGWTLSGPCALLRRTPVRTCSFFFFSLLQN